MKYIDTKDQMPAPGQLIVKRWKSGAVWAGRYAGGPKESSFDEWASLEPGPVAGQDQNDLAAIAAAKAEHESEGTLEIDDNAVVSFSADRGAYVAAWVWVGDDQIKEQGGTNPESPEEGEGA